MLNAKLQFLACLVLFSFLFAGVTAQQTVGLFQNDAGASDGYTLLAPIPSTNTYLLDNCGQVVHEWGSGYTPGNVCKLLENGSLFRTCRIANTNFNAGGLGGRVQLQDWSGNVTWFYQYTSTTYSQHHDAVYMPNGNIILIAWESKTRAEAIAAGRDTSLLGQRIWPDHLIEIEPTTPGAGNIVWEWHAMDHLVQDFDSSKANFGVVADHPERINFNYVRPGSANFRDWMHTNAIAYNPTWDQLAISIHNFDEIWIIDHSTTTLEAANHTGGNYGKGGDLLYRFGNPEVYGRGTSNDHLLFGMHDVQWVPAGDQYAGQLMVFNNGLNRPAGNYSTIEIWEPPVDSLGFYNIVPNQPFGPISTTWTYQDNPTTNFYSMIISGVQRLPNNHTLIAEGTTGRIFEIDDQSNKLWEYVNPVEAAGPLSQGVTPTNNSIFRACKYDPTYSGLAGQVLTPGDRLELNPLPLPSNCVGVATEQANSSDFNIYPNPFEQSFQVRFPFVGDQIVEVYDMQGRQVVSTTQFGNEIEVDAVNLPMGLYYVKLRGGKAAKKVEKSWR